MTGGSYPARLLALALAAGIAGLLGGCDLILPHRTEGEKLYRKHCAQCHGLDGAGNTPGYMGNAWADLTDDRWKTRVASASSLEQLLREGVFGQMPAYTSQQLSRQQVKEIYEHMRVLRGEKRPEPQP